MVLFSELMNKDVINIRDGSRLGYIQDLKINASNGDICSVMVPGPSKIVDFFGGNHGEYWIEWCQICKIGTDIILVDIDLLRCFKEKAEKQKNRLFKIF